jgi:hypothetical protein
VDQVYLGTSHGICQPPHSQNAVRWAPILADHNRPISHSTVAGSDEIRSPVWLQ